MAPRVRQMRGPGMNKGLKKPRHGQFPRTKDSTPVTPGSLDSTRSRGANPNSGQAAGQGTGATNARRNSGSTRVPRAPGSTYLSRNVWGE